MIRSNKIYLLLIASFFAATFITSLGAEENCVHCGTKKPEEKEPIYSVDSYLNIYCKRYIKIERNELPRMVQELENTGYPVEAFFQKAECYPEKVGGIKSPILHLTAEAPCSRVDYPRIIHFYFKEKPEIWEKVVNAKNSLGETYLDYIESLIREGEFTTDKSKACVSKLIAFACSTTPPAIYSKFKNDKTCPSPDIKFGSNIY